MSGIDARCSTERDALPAWPALTADLPLDLRYKKTRAIRRRLTHNEKTAITEKQHKRQIHFPQRKYALKA